MEKLFKPSWIIACHESELAERVRLSHVHPSRRRAADHRARRGPEGAQLLQHLPAPRQHAALRPGGQRQAHDLHLPRVVVRHHAATASTSRAREQGYQDRFCKAGRGAARGARRKSASAASSGSTSTTRACTLKEYIGAVAGHARRPTWSSRWRCSTTTARSSTPTTSCGTTPTASSITTIMHYFNRITGMMQPGYFERKYTGVSRTATPPSARCRSSTTSTKAARSARWAGRAWRRAAGYMVDIFPGMTYNLRTSVLRIDTVDSARSEQGADRVPRPGPEERHAGAARASAYSTTTRSGARSAATCTRTCSACTARDGRCASAPTAAG